MTEFFDDESDDDFDDVFTSDDDSGDDLWGMFGAIIKKVNFKIAFIIFIIFVLINTTFFISSILGKHGLTNGMAASQKGIVVQGLILSFGYVLFDTMHSGGLI